MSKRILLFSLILLTVILSLLPALETSAAGQKGDKKSPLRCTSGALAALKPIPKLEYDCIGNTDEDLISPERKAALRTFLKEIETTYADDSWWATSVEDLKQCAMTNEARDLTDDEREQLRYKIDLFGDGSTRLLTVVDPCIWYSSSTLNSYVLQREGNKVYATQVLNAYYTRIDEAVAMEVAENNGERLIFVSTNTSDGMMPPSPFTTYYVYTINPQTHRAVPKNIFFDKRLTNRFRYDGYLFADQDEKLANRWHAPEFVHNGKLASRFTVYYLINHRLSRDTYIWNGKYFTRSR
jgi:hypothetical protein